MTPKELLALNLKRLRKAEKMTQATLAERAGLSETYIGQIETKATFISDESLMALAAALRAPVMELFRSPMEQVKAPSVQEALEVLANATGSHTPPLPIPKNETLAKILKLLEDKPEKFVNSTLDYVRVAVASNFTNADSAKQK